MCKLALAHILSGFPQNKGTFSARKALSRRLRYTLIARSEFLSIEPFRHRKKSCQAWPSRTVWTAVPCWSIAQSKPVKLSPWRDVCSANLNPGGHQHSQPRFRKPQPIGAPGKVKRIQIRAVALLNATKS